MKKTDKLKKEILEVVEFYVKDEKFLVAVNYKPEGERIQFIETDIFIDPLRIVSYMNENKDDFPKLQRSHFNEVIFEKDNDYGDLVDLSAEVNKAVMKSIILEDCTVEDLLNGSLE